MLKKNEYIMVLITSAMTLLPILVGIVYWNQLPEQISMEYLTRGMFGAFSPKWMVVFVFPLLFLVAHMFCLKAVVGKTEDEKARFGVLGRVGHLVCPVLSIIAAACTYGKPLGWF